METGQVVGGREYPTAADFGEVVVFGGQPEDRYGGDSLVRKLSGEPDRRQGLVDCVDRAGVQAHLLPRHDRDGARLLQPVQGFARSVQRFERLNEAPALLGLEANLTGRSGE
ncbi:MAG: hypothetical protein IPM24_21425 [Bryobacterales bacterium]|nr:hypothetical protein [Bryobacterales bacterium]